MTSKAAHDLALARKTKTLKKGSVYLFLGGEDREKTVPLTIVEQLVKNRGLNGIVVTLDSPVSVWAKRLDKRGVNLSNVFFVDMASKEREYIIDYLRLNVDAPNYYIAENVHSLIELSSIIVKETEKKKYGFLLLDAPSTLFEANPQEFADNFLNYLSSKLREFGFIGIMTCERAKYNNSIEKHADRIIRL